jgi:hypothetical protein
MEGAQSQRTAVNVKVHPSTSSCTANSLNYEDIVYFKYVIDDIRIFDRDAMQACQNLVT